MSELTDDRLLPGCKMRSRSRYASDEDCTACGLGEGSACATYERLSAARLAKLRAQVPAKPEPSVKAIAWEIASFLGATPWAVDDGGVEVWERYKPLAEAVTSIALRAAASTSTEGAGVIEAARTAFNALTYPVSTEIDPKGYSLRIERDEVQFAAETLHAALNPPASKATTDEAEERG